MSSTTSPQPTYTYPSVYYNNEHLSLSRALAILIIGAVCLLLCIVVCIVGCIHRSKLNKKNVQVQLVQPEVENSIRPADLSGASNAYFNNVNNNGNYPVYRTPNGEELVLVPRHLLAPANGFIPQQQQQRENSVDDGHISSMEAIREASGVYLGQGGGTGQLLLQQPYFDQSLQAQPLCQGQLTPNNTGANAMPNVSTMQRREEEVSEIVSGGEEKNVVEVEGPR
ncbi:hypothetical protein EDD21DRAFT_378470 [Dissophora ornata]|nr:hypothetical protein EDD21DRAFT_378470 [Dissophora ornata]